MSDPEPEHIYHISKGRVEAMADGIFAFSMTLLVVTLNVPELGRMQAAAELPARVAAMHSEFFAFLIAFFVLAAFWLVHHRQFHLVRNVDKTIVRINILILASAVLMPFSTSISGDYDYVQTAVLIFHINMFLIGALFLVHWYYICTHPHLLSTVPDQKAIDYGIRRSSVVPVTALFAIALSFITPDYSMMSYLAIPFLTILVTKSSCP